MKIIVVSDSHGDVEILKEIVRINPNADIYLHLGDSCVEENYLGPFVSVKGNCDYFSSYPEYRIIRTSRCNIYANHGHLHTYVNNAFLKSKDCKIYLFGHTHCHYINQDGEYLYLNPGSVSRPRDNTNGTYMILNINKDEIEVEIKEIGGKENVGYFKIS